ncbi:MULTISPECIES: hypothetical protein [Methylobacterium]|uniref:hypothetical protein n=1 Tax=Methylobacterium TaxID=407 RepID=UPI00272E3336|nr:hypothetical protein [Methylobacterium sp.]
MIRVAAAAALAAFLAGCQTVSRPAVPPSLLTCADAPVLAALRGEFVPSRLDVAAAVQAASRTRRPRP